MAESEKLERLFDEAMNKFDEARANAERYKDDPIWHDSYRTAAWFELGIMSALRMVNEIDKKDLIAGIDNQIVFVKKKIKDITQELDAEEEINPVSEEAKRLGMELAEYREVLADIKRNKKKAKKKLRRHEF